MPEPTRTELPPTPNTAFQVGLALMVACVAAYVGTLQWGCATLPANKVVAGANVILEQMVALSPTPNVTRARDQLEAGDLQGAIESLRAEGVLIRERAIALKVEGAKLVETVYQRDVAALLALLQSQLPDGGT